MAGDTNFSSVVLLVHADDAAYPDTSNYAHTVTATSVVLDTVVKKFGAGSAHFSFGGSALSIADAPELDLSTGDWTIEAQGRFDSGFLGANDSPLIHKQDSGHFPFKITVNVTGNIIASGTDDNGASVYSIDGGVLTADTFVHIALTRHGSTFTLWLNGVSAGTATSALALNVNVQPVQIGGRTAASAPFHGWADEIRVTKGVARYTTGFTPAAAAFDDFGAPESWMLPYLNLFADAWFPAELLAALHFVHQSGHTKAQAMSEIATEADSTAVWAKRRELRKLFCRPPKMSAT